MLFPLQGNPSIAVPPTDGDTAVRTQAPIILVIDDEEPVRSLAKRVLESHDYVVKLASDGRQGVEIFRQHAESIQAVLLDATMPGVSGEETCRQLRRICPQTPILLSSGYPQEDLKARFADQELPPFIRKPYRVADLLSRLREIIDR